MIGLTCYASTTEPKHVQDALKNEFWVMSMQEELAQFSKNEV